MTFISIKWQCVCVCVCVVRYGLYMMVVYGAVWYVDLLLICSVLFNSVRLFHPVQIASFPLFYIAIACNKCMSRL
jgi:hypothetical protein